MIGIGAVTKLTALNSTAVTYDDRVGEIRHRSVRWVVVCTLRRHQHTSKLWAFPVGGGYDSQSSKAITMMGLFWLGSQSDFRGLPNGLRCLHVQEQEDIRCLAPGFCFFPLHTCIYELSGLGLDPGV